MQPRFNLLDRHGLDQAIPELALKPRDPSFNVEKVTSGKSGPLLNRQILVDSSSDRNRVFFLLEMRSIELGGIQNTLVERLEPLGGFHSHHPEVKGHVQSGGPLLLLLLLKLSEFLLGSFFRSEIDPLSAPVDFVSVQVY